MPLYLDYNATTPVHPEVLEAMVETYKENYGNAGSRTHVFGQRANQAVEWARSQIASILGVDKSEVIFTSGATESNNLAILGLAKWGAEQGRRHIISTEIEHKAVLEPLNYLKNQGFEIELVPPDRTGRISADDVLRRVRPDTLLVSVMHANNETGVVQPVHEIGEALSGTETYFHVDAAQTFGKLIDELQTLKYDLLSISGHKIYGPQGVGALIRRRRRHRRPPIQPLMYGGGQERGLRPGTLPVALIVGLGKAVEVAQREHSKWLSQARTVKESILQQLHAVHHVVNGSLEHSLPTCLNVSFPGIDSEALMLALREELAISNGSACTSAEYKPSHVLMAMGLDDSVVRSAVRISWGYNITSVDLEPLISVVRSLQ